jgi:hypothetical protein
MKLRVRNNSIRLRLSQSEVARLKHAGSVEEVIEFGSPPDKNLVYRLITADAEAVTAKFENGKVTVTVPESRAQHWTDSNQVEIESEQIIGGNKTLKILIEKDFACLDRRDGEDDSDAFPQPEQGKIC